MTADAPRDRDAYLAEQIERQKRGESIDVEWVRAELERVNREAQAKLAASQQRLRWVVLGMAGLLCAFWIARNVLNDGDPKPLVPIVVIAALTAWTAYRQRRGR